MLAVNHTMVLFRLTASKSLPRCWGCVAAEGPWASWESRLKHSMAHIEPDCLGGHEKGSCR